MDDRKKLFTNPVESRFPATGVQHPIHMMTTLFVLIKSKVDMTTLSTYNSTEGISKLSHKASVTNV